MLCDQPLRVVGRVAAHHADGARLGDVFGDRQQLRHRLERLAEVVLVEAGHDDAHAARGQRRRTTAGSSASKNWPSSMPTTSVSGLTLASSSAARARLLGRNPQLAVRDDVVVGVAGVDGGLEDLDTLAGDLGAAQPADELFALAAEHAADDDFDPARGWGSDDVHIVIYTGRLRGPVIAVIGRSRSVA